MAGKRLTPDVIGKIKTCFVYTKDAQHIADHYEISLATVYAIKSARSHGNVFPFPTDRHLPDIKDSYLTKGMDYKEISEYYDWPLEVIKSFLNGKQRDIDIPQIVTGKHVSM